MVAEHCFKTDILITSILHDTIEDTKLTKEMLAYIFDENIANKVEEELLFIKLFDRLHNVQTIAPIQ